VAIQSPTREVRRDTWFAALRGSLYVMRVPIVMAVATVVILSLSEQAQEVYRVLAQDRPGTPGIQYHYVFAVLSLVALSLVLWQVARSLSYDYDAHETAHPVARVALRWVPRLLVMAPLIGAAIGVFLCQADDLGGRREPLLKDFVVGIYRLQDDFLLGIAICLGLAVLLFLVAWLFERRVSVADRTRRVAFSSSLVIFPIIAAASVALIAFEPIGMSQFFGVVPVFALWMAVLALIVGLLARFSIFAIPVLGLVVVYALAIEYFKLADNHEIRYEDRIVQRRALDEAFDKWLESRKDRAAFQAAKRPYPVYIVAAEGGGLYAAYQTAQFLTRMQDLCPSFAQHVFSISSVSGGSLGAAVYAGLVAGQPQVTQPAACKSATSPGPLENQAKDILSSDFLAPVVWGALFPDFLQRFIPYPLPILDRARLLELAMEQSWPTYGVGSKSNPMAKGLFDLCGNDMKGCLEGATPLLALNVTNVETGLQLVLSPLDLVRVGSNADASLPPTGKIYDFFGVPQLDGFHMPLSTAVGLSARFPWLSPPGWYKYDPPLPKEEIARRHRVMKTKSGKSRLTFLDGGFVDNSGVATALNIAEFLNARRIPDVEFRVIMVSALWAPLARLRIDPPLDRNSGETLPPLDAAYNSRQGRGYKTQFDAALEAKPGLNISETGFYYGYLELALGWQLSDVSRTYITLFRGQPERCVPTAGRGYDELIGRDDRSHARLAAAYIRRSDCLVAKLKNELTPSEPRLDIPPINPVN
jgi:hypothetical protein